MQEVALDELGMVRGATLVHTGWSALVENLDLSELAADGVRQFLFVYAFPTTGEAVHYAAETALAGAAAAV